MNGKGGKIFKIGNQGPLLFSAKECRFISFSLQITHTHSIDLNSTIPQTTTSHIRDYTKKCISTMALHEYIRN